MATRQRIPPEVRADDPLKHKIMDAGYFPCRIVRRFAPHDTGDTAEVLFLGHERTYRNRGETRPLDSLAARRRRHGRGHGIVGLTIYSTTVSLRCSCGVVMVVERRWWAKRLRSKAPALKCRKCDPAEHVR